MVYLYGVAARLCSCVLCGCVRTVWYAGRDGVSVEKVVWTALTAWSSAVDSGVTLLVGFGVKWWPVERRHHGLVGDDCGFHDRYLFSCQAVRSRRIGTACIVYL